MEKIPAILEWPDEGFGTGDISLKPSDSGIVFWQR